MTTQTHGTVVLGFGPQEMDWLSKACKVTGKDAVLDPDVARMAGANLAAGTPESLGALRKRLEAGALQAQTQATPGMSEAATHWLAHGERGVSSDTIFSHLTGIDVLNGWRKDHPYDTSDFRRCRLLLEQVPELADSLAKMRSLSDAWRGLVDNWADICAAMDWEMPDWRNSERGCSAPKTYQLIKRAIGR